MVSKRLYPFLVGVLSLGLMVVAGGGEASAQDSLKALIKEPRTAEDYIRRSFADVALEAPDTEMQGNMEGTMKIYGDIRPSRVRVVFSDSIRPIPATGKEIIRQFAMRYAGFPEFYTGPYQHEILVVENGVEHWVAVRMESVSTIRKELHKGDSLDLHLIRVGSALTRTVWKPVLLVESFDRLE